MKIDNKEIFKDVYNRMIDEIQDDITSINKLETVDNIDVYSDNSLEGLFKEYNGKEVSIIIHNKTK